MSSTETSNTSHDTLHHITTRQHGLPLLPFPTQDPKDPLRWPRYLKLAALGATAFFNFTANFAGAGFSVATPVLERQLHRSASSINNLMTFNFLFLGIGNLIWVPLGVKYGNRASLLLSMTMLFAVLIWTAKETTYSGLLAARCLSGFASAAGESIVPSIVADIFFLHERAAMMSGYTILISGATAIGPLCASFIVEYSRGGWVDFIWVCAALAGANIVAIYLLYPESNFTRPNVPVQHVPLPGTQSPGCEGEKGDMVRVEDASRHYVSVVKKPWMSIWKPSSIFTINRDVSLPKTFVLPLKMLARPSVLLAVYIYGTSLASQVILIFAFPSFLLAPPYLFSGSGVGLMQIAAIIGFIFGCFTGGYLADIITAAIIRRQNGDVYPEQRLLAILPFSFIAPAGCILAAFACSLKLHWAAVAVGFGMVSFGTIYAPNIAITYVVESYPKAAAECLVSINVFKNLVAFLFLYTAVDWLASSGWLQVYMIMFMLVTLGMIASVMFYICRHK
ncbi:putative MFS transporter [Setomelanomma holmii]|uniref:MFS transporter n=1 Tax=Setomelanomma holmii TaxID=210430 RepID=A0A9P4HGG3_9PLEO|nr:putative MFS transporter [Setomelanomma holmii]